MTPTPKIKMLSILLKKKPESKHDDMSEDDDMPMDDETGNLHEEGLKQAMQEFLQAVKDSDVNQMVESFRNALDCHEDMPDEDDEEDEHEDSEEDES